MRRPHRLARQSFGDAGRSAGGSGVSRRCADVSAPACGVIDMERAGSMNRRGARSRGCVAALVDVCTVPASTVDAGAAWCAFAVSTDGSPLTRSPGSATAGHLT